MTRPPNDLGAASLPQRRDSSYRGRPCYGLPMKNHGISKFGEGDLFAIPYDTAYVQTRIDALGNPGDRAQWATHVEQLRKCANPPRGMEVTADARALARAKMKELGARNRRGRA